MLGDNLNRNQGDAMSNFSGFDASSIADPAGSVRSVHHLDGHYNPN